MLAAKSIGDNGRRPWVHIAVDVGVRELDAKVFLAAILLSKGYNVTIFQMREFWRTPELFPRGVYIDTRFNLPRKNNYIRFRQLGFKVAAFDEEATNIPDINFYQLNSVREESLGLCDAAFCWGDFHSEVVRQGLPQHLQHIVASTGHPRFDLLRPDVRPFYAREAQRIKSQHGKFVLINSSSSGVVHSGKTVDFWEKVVGRGTIIDTRENRDRFFDFYHYKAKRHSELVALLVRAARAMPDQKFIVRPKFNEDPEHWRAILPSDLTNVQLIHEGSAVPWMMASAVVLHSGCTTGTEAFLADIPVISYLTQFQPGVDSDVPDTLSVKARTEDEAVTSLSVALRGRLTVSKEERTAQLETAEHHIAARDGPTASERIASCLQNVAFVSEEDSFSAWTRDEPQRTGLIDRHYSEGRIPTKNQGNYGGLTYDGVAQRLGMLFPLIPRLEPTVLSNVRPHIFTLMPAGAMHANRLRSFLSRFKPRASLTNKSNSGASRSQK